MTFRDLDRVVLARDLLAAGVVAGTAGVIVFSYTGVEVFEVECFAPDGSTLAVVTVTAADIRHREVTP